MKVEGAFQSCAWLLMGSVPPWWRTGIRGTANPLWRLEQIDPLASRVVELRYFTGLRERETAEALDISISTLKRDWNFAKAWLFDQLSPGPMRA
jgi:hypothetical protein